MARRKLFAEQLDDAKALDIAGSTVTQGRRAQGHAAPLRLAKASGQCRDRDGWPNHIIENEKDTLRVWRRKDVD